MDFHVSGDNLDQGKVERAVTLSAEKYCSASRMLEDAGIELSHRVTLLSYGQSDLCPGLFPLNLLVASLNKPIIQMRSAVIVTSFAPSHMSRWTGFGSFRHLA